MKHVPLGDLFADKVTSLDPSRFSDEEFELWSIPAFDVGKPDIVAGSEIGSTKKCVEPNDVLLSRIVPHIRRSWIVSGENDKRKIASSEWIVFRNQRVAPNYLRHFLISDPFHAQFMLTVAGVGGSLLRARPDGVAKIKIPLPPLGEQRRIAAILDAADALRRKRREALGLLEGLPQALFVEMFGDPISNPKGWPTQRASEFCSRITVGIVVKPASYYKHVGIPAIRGTNIKPEGIDLSDCVFFSQEDNSGKLAKTRVWEGDVIVVRSGRPGLAAVIPAELDGVNSIDVLIATPNIGKVRSRFVRDLINSDSGRRIVLSESRGQIQQHFNVGSLSDAKFFVPDLPVQDQYEERLDNIEGLISKSRSHLAHLDRLFASLQHRAFAGEL